MARAFSVTEVMSMRKEIIPFSDSWMAAFDTPERTGVWFVWGNSGNGKSSFVMQMCKELTLHGRVIYDSLEEGVSLTMKNSLKLHAMNEVSRRFTILDREPVSELSVRLSKRRSADFVVIDSFQYAQLSYKEYKKFISLHPDKLLIFISQAEGSQPLGRTAKSVRYDASLKIWVEGFRAISKGRYFGDKGYYNIWDKGVLEYWKEL